MDDNVKSRILKFLEYKKINASQFSQQIGVSRNYVSSMSKSIQPDKLHSISVHFPELNIEWLLIGKGEMLSSTAQNSGINKEILEKFYALFESRENEHKTILGQNSEIIRQNSDIIKQNSRGDAAEWRVDKDCDKIYREMKKAIYILYVIVFALAGWFASVCYRDLRFDADSSAGIIVSILGIMVTSLIGWQIYSVINLKEIQKALDKSTNEVNMIKCDFNNFKKYVDAETYANNATSLYILNRYIESILNILKALQLYAEIESYTYKKDDIKRGIHLCVTNWATCLTEGRGKSQYSGNIGLHRRR